MSFTPPPAFTKTVAISLVVLVSLNLSASAFASYDSTVHWTDMKALDLEKVFKSHYASAENIFHPSIQPSSFVLSLDDADNRISSDFKVKEPMKNIVGFWLKIYTQYTSRHFVIFDKKHPEVIYEVMDFRDLFQTSKNLVVYEIVREKRIKARLAQYRTAFHGMLRKKNLTPDTKGLSPLQKSILTALQTSSHHHKLSESLASLKGQTGQRDNVIKGLLAAETFFPKMEEIFRQLEVPTELTRIPLVESSFNLNANSKVGAAGVWQFMPVSGKEFLRVDRAGSIDERLSPLKSTVAAARLLKRNLAVTGNWPLAITAYNHGYSGIRHLKPSERAFALDGNLFRACQKKKYLGYASSNYYAEFLALLHAEAYKDLFYGESPLPVSPPLAFRQVEKPESAFKYALEHSISLHEFQLFNPDIMNLNRKIPRGFYVAVPSKNDTVDELISAIRLKPTRVRARVTMGH